MLIRRVADPLVFAGESDIHEEHRLVDNLEVQRAVKQSGRDVKRCRPGYNVLFHVSLILPQRYFNLCIEQPLVVRIRAKEM